MEIRVAGSCFFQLGLAEDVNHSIAVAGRKSSSDCDLLIYQLNSHPDFASAIEEHFTHFALKLIALWLEHSVADVEFVHKI